eukprot:scaffold230969_cov35-Tisochrysis_lutea.AAC.3
MLAIFIVMLEECADVWVAGGRHLAQHCHLGGRTARAVVEHLDGDLGVCLGASSEENTAGGALAQHGA